MQAWHKVGEELVFDGRRTIVRRRFVLPDGEEVEYDVKAEPDVVAVLAITPDEQVVAVREYRAGPQELLLELPGGGLDPDERPLDGARRELLEETGYSGELEYIGGVLDCAYSTRTRHACVARNCRRVAEPAPHAGEHLEVVLVPLVRFVAHVREGRLTDVAAAYRALDELGALAPDPSEPASTPERNKRALLRIVDEILNGGDLDAIDELVAEEYVDGFGGPSGREGYRDLVRSLRRSFPDGRLWVEDVVAEGDKVVGRFTFRGTHEGEFRGIPPTGREVEFAGIGIVRFDDGRMIERWNVSDVQCLLEQLS